MHVCLITSARASEVPYGSVEKFTILLRNWLSSRGHNVTVVERKLFGVKILKRSCCVPCVEPGIKQAHPRLLRLGYPVFVWAMLITSLLIVLHVIAINRKSRISIIHAQDTGYGGLPAIISAKVLRVPVIVSSHGLRYLTLSNVLKGVSATFLLPWEYWLDVFTSKRADLMINVSSSGEKFFAKIGVEKDRMKMIPFGIETCRFNVSEEARQTMRKELGSQDDVLVGFVGRLSKEKNLLTLLEAFAKALRYTDKMKLVIVGAGPMEGDIRMLSYDRGINHKIVFTGIRYDVNQLLSALDIFTLPSYTEGCPASLIEAMASGKAIVAGDIPSIREIVRHGKEAILVNPYNVEALTRAILLLHRDSDLRAKLGCRARKRARLYDADRVYSEILNLYEELTRLRI